MALAITSIGQVAGIVRVEPAVHDATVVGPGRRATRNPGVRGHVGILMAADGDLLPRVDPDPRVVEAAHALGRGTAVDEAEQVAVVEEPEAVHLVDHRAGPRRLWPTNSSPAESTPRAGSPVPTFSGLHRLIRSGSAISA